MLALAALACGEGRSPSRASDTAGGETDDFGDTLALPAPPRRIVSLNPVTTEILFALGAGGRLAGRTHWDLYPERARAVTDLGDGMRPNVEAVLGARPDLVVLYASPSNRPATAAFRRAGVATLTLRTDHIADFTRAVRALARAVGDTAAGRVLADSVSASLAAVRRLGASAKPPTVFWHVWDAPLLTIGRGSYLSELVEIAGGRNVFDDLAAPSPQVSLEEVVRRNPDFVLAGPVNATRIRRSAAWRAVPAVRAGRILVVDTTLVGRPGPRLGEAARHLHALLAGATAP